jgi:sugar lactone lactonase YvrE
LKPGELIPTGAELDTTHGRVRLFVASDAHGGIQSADVYSGRFIFRQTGRAHPRTTFVLSQPLTGCARASPRATRPPSAGGRARRPTRRQVWVTEKGGNFNTKGQYVGTSVQGTIWLTADTCTTSTVRVKQGVVTVHDFIHHRTIKLHAGQTYTAQKTTPPPATATAHLYWANVDGTIVEANLDGTGAKTVANGQSAPNGVAVSGSHLYWASPGTGTIVEANLDGTGAKTIAEGQSYPYGVAVGGGHLYWANNYGFGPRATGAIVEANLDGTGAKTIASGQGGPNGVAISGSHLYWANDTAGTIVEANLDGAGAQAIASGQSTPTGMAVSGTHLYWASYGRYGNTGKIVEADLDGTAAKTIAKGQLGPDGVAVNGSHLYWANSGGTIVEADLNGKGAQTIAKGQSPRGVAVGP